MCCMKDPIAFDEAMQLARVAAYMPRILDLQREIADLEQTLDEHDCRLSTHDGCLCGSIEQILSRKNEELKKLENDVNG